MSNVIVKQEPPSGGFFVAPAGVRGALLMFLNVRTERVMKL